MATVVMSGTDRKASERKFYSRMALFLVLLVLLGFGPSFYLKGIVPAYPRPNPTLPPTVILHGAVFTLWMALIVVQTQLIAARKHAVHMQLGKAGMLLAILLIPVMYLTAVWQVARANQPLDAAGASPLSVSGSYGPLLLLASPIGLDGAVGQFLLDIQPGYTRDPVRGVYNHGWIVGDEAAMPVAVQARIDSLLEITAVENASANQSP